MSTTKKKHVTVAPPSTQKSTPVPPAPASEVRPKEPAATPRPFTPEFPGHIAIEAPNVPRIMADLHFQIGYLARNMSESFDGLLGSEESNAHAALTAVLGHLCTLNEEIGTLAYAVSMTSESRAVKS